MHACNHAWDVPSVFIHRALVCWLQVGHPGPTGRLITGFRCRRLFEQHFLYTTHSETHAANQRRSTGSQTKGRHQPATAPHLRGFSWCAPGNIALNSGALPTLSHRQHPAPKRQLQKRNKNKKIATPYSSCFSQPGCHGSMVVNGEQGKPKQCGLRSFRSRD